MKPKSILLNCKLSVFGIRKLSCLTTIFFQHLTQKPVWSSHNNYTVKPFIPTSQIGHPPLPGSYYNNIVLLISTQSQDKVLCLCKLHFLQHSFDRTRIPVIFRSQPIGIVQCQARGGCTYALLQCIFQPSQSDRRKESIPESQTYQTPVRPTKMILLHAIAQRSSVHRPRNIFSSMNQGDRSDDW